MIRVQAAPPEHHRWIAERAGLTLLPGFMALEALDGDRIVGMVGFERLWEQVITLHIALDAPVALRKLAIAGFRTAFEAPPEGLGAAAVTATVFAHNARSLDLVRHLGFTHIHTGYDYRGAGKHVEFFEMRRGDCRFIPQELRRAA